MSRKGIEKLLVEQPLFLFWNGTHDDQREN